MHTLRLAFSSLALAVIISVTSIHQVFAKDIEVFLKELQERAEKRGNELSYESVTQTGNKAVIKQFKYQLESSGDSISANEVSFENFEELGDNGFAFDNLEVLGLVQINNTEDSNKRIFRIERILADEVTNPGLDDREYPIWPLNIASADLTNITYEISNDEGTSTIQSLGVEVSGLEQTDGSGFKVASFNIKPINGSAKNSSAETTFTFDGIKILKAEYLGSSGYQISSLEAGKFNLESTGDASRFGIDLNSFEGENLYSPNLNDPNSSILPKKPVTFEIGEAEFRNNGSRVAGWDIATGESKANASANTILSEALLKNLYVDLRQIPVTRQNKRALDTIKELGYDQLEMNISANGSWNLTSGELALDSYRTDIKNALALDLSLKLAGYTEELARRISSLTNQMNSATDPQERGRQSIQIVAELSSLVAEKLSLKLEDKSALDRVLDLQASRSNQDKKSIASIVPILAGSVLAPFNVPELASQMTNSLGIFMQGEKTIEISAEPNEPIAFTQLLAILSGVRNGTTQPSEVVERLNVQIKAE